VRKVRATTVFQDSFEKALILGSEAQKWPGFTDCSVGAGPASPNFDTRTRLTGSKIPHNLVPVKIPKNPIDPLYLFESIPLENRNPLGFSVLGLKTAAPRSL
jgi:hypothetical protein